MTDEIRNGFAAIKGDSQSRIEVMRDTLEDRMDEDYEVVSSGEVSMTSSSSRMKQGELLVAFNGYLEKISATPEKAIAEAYRNYGEDFVKHIEGSYRTAVYDSDNDRMIVSADKIGRKVIYYTEDTEDFICSSHLRPVLKHDQVDRELDDRAVTDFLQSWSVSFGGGRRLIEGVSRLEPSHRLIYSKGDRHKKKFWDVYDGKRDVSDEQAVSRLDELLSEAAENLLERENGDINIFLSGGFDSVFLTKLLSEATERQIDTYTWGWKDEHFRDAEKMSEMLGTEQHSMKMEYSLPSKEEVRFYEEPHNAFVRYPFRELHQQGLKSYWTGLNSQATFPVCLKNVRKLDRAKRLEPAVKIVGAERLTRLAERYGSYKLSKGVHVMGSEDLSTAAVDDWGLRQDHARKLLTEKALERSEKPSERLDRKWDLRPRSYQENYSYLQLRSRDTARYAYYAQDLEHMDVFGYTPLLEYSYSLPMAQKKNRRLLQKIAKGRVPDRIITKGASGWEFVSEQFRRKIENNRAEYRQTMESFLDRGYLEPEKGREFLIRDSYEGLTKGPINQMIAVLLLEKWIQAFIEDKG